MTAKRTERFYYTNELKKSSADITVTSSVYFPDVIKKPFQRPGGGVTVNNTMCYFYKLSDAFMMTD